MAEFVRLVSVSNGVPLVLLSEVQKLCCECPHQLCSGVVEESQHENWKSGDKALWPGGALFWNIGDSARAIVPVMHLIAKYSDIPATELN